MGHPSGVANLAKEVSWEMPGNTGIGSNTKLQWELCHY